MREILPACKEVCIIIVTACLDSRKIVNLASQVLTGDMVRYKLRYISFKSKVIVKTIYCRKKVSAINNSAKVE